MQGLRTGRRGPTLALMSQESDRGFVLAIAALLDDAVGDLIKAHMIPECTSELRKRILKYPGVLASAAARLNVACAFGWIGADTHHNLRNAKADRNKFAHSRGPLKFDSAEIKALCEKFRVPDMDGFRPHPPERSSFLLATQWALLHIWDAMDRCETPAQHVERPIRRIDSDRTD